MIAIHLIPIDVDTA